MDKPNFSEYPTVGVHTTSHGKPSCSKCNDSGVQVASSGNPERDARLAPCPECNGTGQRDSGGTYPWGESIFVACGCEAVSNIKPHVIRELVNELTEIARQYHDHQSLRERIAGPIHRVWLGK